MFCKFKPEVPLFMFLKCGLLKRHLISHILYLAKLLTKKVKSKLMENKFRKIEIRKRTFQLCAVRCET